MNRELMSQYIEGKRTSSRRELVTTRKLLLCLALMEAARLIIIETHGYVLLPNCEALLVLSSLKVALYVGGLYICGKVGDLDLAFDLPP
ncbi:unnamed protein product [Brassica napus]|uniref:(rape) hypothetical protein n=1 Tax=Brassica napus TaxID=3708 RepID=A0A816P4S9_BRANA|nr:unnamed protein product [Brassica napus]